MAVRHEISDWERDMFARSTIEGNVLRLPERLERADYIKIAKAIERLGGKWDRRANGHAFPFDPSELIESAAASGVVESRQQKLQAFFTPADLAESMVQMAGGAIGPGKMMLEPSAGMGALCRPALTRLAWVTAVEIDPHHCSELIGLGGLMSVHQADFMAWEPPGGQWFDAVLMNPPFSNGQDMAHVRRAYGFLRPGGQLVAICSRFTDRSDSKSKAFGDWLRAIKANIGFLPRGTFKASGTEVPALLIHAHKGDGP